MLQQQETYAQQLASLHDLVKAQAIAEAGAVTAEASFCSTVNRFPVGHPAGVPMQHAAFPADRPQQPRTVPAEDCSAKGCWQPTPPPMFPQQLLRPRTRGAAPHDQSSFGAGDFSRINAPPLQPTGGGGLFTWHEEGGDAASDSALQCRSFPSVGRNSWDWLMPDAIDRMGEGGQERGPSAACWDAQQALGMPPLRKRQALAPRGGAGKVILTGPYTGMVCY